MTVEERLDHAAYRMLTDGGRHEFGATMWAALRLGVKRIALSPLEARELAPLEVIGARPTAREFRGARQWRRNERRA